MNDNNLVPSQPLSQQSGRFELVRDGVEGRLGNIDNAQSDDEVTPLRQVNALIAASGGGGVVQNATTITVAALQALGNSAVVGATYKITDAGGTAIPDFVYIKCEPASLFKYSECIIYIATADRYCLGIFDLALNNITYCNNPKEQIEITNDQGITLSEYNWITWNNIWLRNISLPNNNGAGCYINNDCWLNGGVVNFNTKNNCSIQGIRSNNGSFAFSVNNCNINVATIGNASLVTTGSSLASNLRIGDNSYLTIGAGSTFSGQIVLEDNAQVTIGNGCSFTKLFVGKGVVIAFPDGFTTTNDIYVDYEHSNIEGTFNIGGLIEIDLTHAAITPATIITLTATSTITSIINPLRNYIYEFRGLSASFANGGNLFLEGGLTFTLGANGSTRDYIRFKSNDDGTALTQMDAHNY